MPLIYLCAAWISGYAFAMFVKYILRRFKKRSRYIKELEQENRHLNSVVEFYENINA